jgi:hypothetical protein
MQPRRLLMPSWSWQMAATSLQSLLGEIGPNPAQIINKKARYNCLADCHNDG